MSDIGHEDDCSCGNCQPSAVRMRQLERELAEAKSELAKVGDTAQKAIQDYEREAMKAGRLEEELAKVRELCAKYENELAFKWEHEEVKP